MYTEYNLMMIYDNESTQLYWYPYAILLLVYIVNTELNYPRRVGKLVTP